MKRTYSEKYINDTYNAARMSADDEDTVELAEKGEETEPFGMTTAPTTVTPVMTSWNCFPG